MCGACTVLLDGEAVRSCLLFAVQADGCRGHDDRGPRRRRRRAVAGAGGVPRRATACSAASARPGFVVSVHRAARARTRDPTDDEIREALSGNLCRCTGYQGIVRAVRHAAAATQVSAPRLDRTPTAGRFVGQSVQRREDAAPAHRPRALRRRRHRSRHAARRVRAQRRRPRPHRARSTSTAARAARRCRRRAHRRRPQPRRGLAAADDDRRAEPAERAAAPARRRRRALRRRADRADRRREPLRRRGRVPSWSRSTSSRCRPVVDVEAARSTTTRTSCTPSSAPTSRTDDRRSRPTPELEAAASTARRARRDRDVPPAPPHDRPDGDARHRRRLRAGRPASSTCGSRPRTRTRTERTIARVTGVAAHHVRVTHARRRRRLRPEVLHAARGARPSCWPRTGLGRTGEVDRGPAREPHRRRTHARVDVATVHARARRRRAHPRRATSTTSRTPARSRSAAPAAPARSSACCSPARTSMPAAAVRGARSVWTNTCGRGAYRGPWMFETVAREQMIDVAARARSASIRSSCGAATSSTTARAAVHDRDGHAARRRSARRRRSSRPPTIIDYDAFRAEQQRAFADEGRLLGDRDRALRRAASTGIDGSAGHRDRDRPRRARPARSRVRSAPARTARASRRRWPRSSPRSSASTSTTSPSCRATPRSTPFGGGHRRQPARAVIAGSACRDACRAGARPRRSTIAAHLHGGRARRPRDRRRRGSSVRGTPARNVAARRGRARRATSRPAELPAGHGAGPRSAPRRTQAPPFTWSNACHVCTVEVDRDTGVVDDPALRRERGLRRDDQPDDRRGPDRRRRGAGHRRRALRALRLRRRRQPAHHDVHGLPAADRDRGARRSSTATSRRRRRRPAGTRAWARAAPSGRRPRSSTRSPTRSRSSA